MCFFTFEIWSKNNNNTKQGENKTILYPFFNIPNIVYLIDHKMIMKMIMKTLAIQNQNKQNVQNVYLYF